MRKPLWLVFVCQRLPQSCSLPLSSLLLSSCFCRLLSPTLTPSHPLTLTPSHLHTLTSSHPYTCTHVLPQSKSPIKHSYVLPSHPHTLTLCIISLASTHRHTLICIYPLPSHPHTPTLSYPSHIHSQSHPRLYHSLPHPHTLTPSHPHRYVLLLSGLNLGSSWSDQLSVELLVDYITGQLGGEAVGVARQVHELP